MKGNYSMMTVIKMSKLYRKKEYSQMSSAGFNFVSTFS